MGLIGSAGQRRAFHTLDGVRGVAAIAVVGLHYYASLSPIAFPSAYLAVDLFFMMSGIVIARAYDHRLADGLTPGRFMLIRLVRLYPLYGLALAVAAALVTLATVAGVSNWTPAGFAAAALAQAAMLPNVVATAPRPNLYPSNVPAWSLMCELVSNFAYAALFPFLSRRVLWIAAAVFGVVLAVVAVQRGGVDHGALVADWWIGLVRVGFAFTLGVLIERAHAAGRIAQRPLPAIVAPLVLAAMTAVFLLPVSLGWSKDVAFVAVVCPALCIAAIATEPRWPRVYTVLGLVSYPLYVTHTVIPYERLFATVARRPVTAVSPWSGIVLVVVMIAVSWLLARFYDAPVRRLLSRRLGFASRGGG